MKVVPKQFKKNIPKKTENPINLYSNQNIFSKFKIQIIIKNLLNLKRKNNNYLFMNECL